MTLKEIIIALIIHFIIPLIGLISYKKLTKRMKSENLSKSSNLELFIIFFTYGGLLLVVLTSLFWKWSGMSSLGFLYLILIAPFLMGMIAYKNIKMKGNSIYYNYIHKVALFYFLIAPLTFLILFIIADQSY